MDIEAIVERHRYVLRDEIKYDISEMVRSALTELAAGYELELEKLRGWMKVSNERDARRKERIRQLEAELVPEWCVAVHSTIHPYERSDMDKVVQLLAHAPDATLFDDPQSYYQHWWELLLAAAAAAPQPQKEGE